jgi:Bacterial protein of unknown function (DUF853).
MAEKSKFIEELNSRYQPKGEYIVLGKGMLDGEVITEVDVTVPLKTVNRHGLIAGATGTGKTKTLQVFVEQLSHKGIPTLVMDIKGDLSGIAVEGEQNDKNQRKICKNAIAISAAIFSSRTHDYFCGERFETESYRYRIWSSFTF